MHSENNVEQEEVENVKTKLIDFMIENKVPIPVGIAACFDLVLTNLYISGGLENMINILSNILDQIKKRKEDQDVSK